LLLRGGARADAISRAKAHWKVAFDNKWTQPTIGSEKIFPVQKDIQARLPGQYPPAGVFYAISHRRAVVCSFFESRHGFLQTYLHNPPTERGHLQMSHYSLAPWKCRH